MRMHLGAALGAAALITMGAAQIPGTTGTNNHAAAATGDTEAAKAPDAHEIVSDSVSVAQHLSNDPHLKNLVAQSKGIFILPTRVQGGFLFGGGAAQGVLLKWTNGGWSQPAFMTFGTVSFGAQAGGEAGPTAFLLMSDKALNDFIQANNFSFNANAGLTIVNYSAKGQVSAEKDDVIIWSNTKGAFAGATLSVTDIHAHTAEDHAYHGKNVSTAQILNGTVQNADANRLRNALPG